MPIKSEKTSTHKRKFDYDLMNLNKISHLGEIALLLKSASPENQYHNESYGDENFGIGSKSSKRGGFMEMLGFGQ